MTSNFLSSLSDEQLVVAGWSANKIKELRKYLKISKIQRTPHQNKICGEYSNLKRALAPEVTKKQTKRSFNTCATRTTWTSKMLDMLVDLYVKHNGGEGNENAGPIVDGILDAYPDANVSTIHMTIASIKKVDCENACHGLNGSNKLLNSLADYNRFHQVNRFTV